MDASPPPFLDHPQEAEPPPGAAPLLRAIWHGLRGEWEAAHGIAQDDEGADGSWVHAWLHRIEGDLPNAGYWYRRAGRPVARGDTDAEGRAIGAALLER
ncbi:hypothetical protein LPC08_17210 [Roseomonas sp. OT10]|uniref:hypothetical protein n=1 Tax=Roseomonas cutis TaxID=2897332 RepID=UPI001E28309D|nr:hypothetical protein [Roseomonas sp. OT10]UFN47742.1 hypothetical protein LPC08_17210 [Roseomonas sp. OT10]